MRNETKDRHDILVNVIERITRDYPQLLAHRRVFMKVLSYMNVLTGTMRGVIFKSLVRYYTVAEAEDRKEISKSLLSI